MATPSAGLEVAIDGLLLPIAAKAAPNSVELARARGLGVPKPDAREVAPAFLGEVQDLPGRNFPEPMMGAVALADRQDRLNAIGRASTAPGSFHDQPVMEGLF